MFPQPTAKNCFSPGSYSTIGPLSRERRSDHDPIPIVRSALLSGVLADRPLAVRARTDSRRAFRFMRAHPRRVATLGFLSIALPFMLISYGETAISSGLTGILVAPGPLFVALFAPFLDPSARVDRPGASSASRG